MVSAAAVVAVVGFGGLILTLLLLALHYGKFDAGLDLVLDVFIALRSVGFGAACRRLWGGVE